MKSIGYASFAGCGSLIEAEFGKDSQITEIGDIAFDNSGLTSFFIPKSLRKTGCKIFSDSNNLVSIKIDENCELEVIEKFTFQSIKIKSMIIPKNIKMLREWSFAFCKQLLEIQLLGDEIVLCKEVFRLCN